jgi:hypothetical protein
MALYIYIIATASQHVRCDFGFELISKNIKTYPDCSFVSGSAVNSVVPKRRSGILFRSNAQKCCLERRSEMLFGTALRNAVWNGAQKCCSKRRSEMLLGITLRNAVPKRRSEMRLQVFLSVVIFHDLVLHHI